MERTFLAVWRKTQTQDWADAKYSHDDRYKRRIYLLRLAYQALGSGPKYQQTRMLINDWWYLVNGNRPTNRGQVVYTTVRSLGRYDSGD